MGAAALGCTAAVGYPDRPAPCARRRSARAPPQAQEAPLPARPGVRPPARGAVTGLVAIGRGRKIYLTCKGSGSPTVVLVSGSGGASDEWMNVAPTGHRVGEILPRDLQRSRSAVFPTIAKVTRVCAYDRPNTTSVLDKPTPSTPVPQPTTAAQGVADLHALLDAANIAPPYVLVGASWGGMITNLFARSYPSDVAGLVFVDAASPFLRSALTAAQWNQYLQAVHALRSSGIEVPNYETSTEEILAAGPLPRVAATVVTSSQPWSLLVGTGEVSTWPAWEEAQDRLAALVHATHITNTHSGHVIAIEQPQVVVGAIDQVLKEGRAPSRR